MQISLEGCPRQGRVLGTQIFYLRCSKLIRGSDAAFSDMRFFPVLFHSPWKMRAQYFRCFKTAYFYLSTKSPTWTNNYLTDNRAYWAEAEVATLLIPNTPWYTIHSRASLTAYILNIHLILLCILYTFTQIDISKEASPPKLCMNS
jgi:hypothetical protein